MQHNPVLRISKVCLDLIFLDKFQILENSGLLFIGSMEYGHTGPKKYISFKNSRGLEATLKFDFKKQNNV